MHERVTLAGVGRVAAVGHSIVTFAPREGGCDPLNFADFQHIKFG